MRIGFRLVCIVCAALIFLVAASAFADDPPVPSDFKPFTQAIPGSHVSFDMVPIPAGEFLLGSPDSELGRNPDEDPQVKVKVEPFYMGKFEVTQDEFELFCSQFRVIRSKQRGVPVDAHADAVTYPTPFYNLGMGPDLDRMGRGARFPAVFMSYYAARQYTKWISKKTGRFYRLPTEAEWEYACRAGATTAYSFGDDPKQLHDYGWFFDNSDLKGDPAYREVGGKKPNPWGLYDMHGNVAELVAGQYEADLYEQLKAQPALVDAQDIVVWPNREYPRIAKGGSFNSEAAECRAAARIRVTNDVNLADPDTLKSAHWYSRGDWLGFRVVSPIAQPDAATQARFWDELDTKTRKYFESREDRQAREAFPATQQTAK